MNHLDAGTAVTVEYENSLDDLVAFSVEHVKRTAWNLKGTLQGGVMFFGLVLIVLIVTIGFSLVGLGITVLVSVIWTIVTRPFCLWLIARHARRVYSQGQNKGLLGPHTLTIRDDGLHEASATGTQHVRFEGIEQVIETDSYVYIYTSAVGAHVVPRHNVTSGNLSDFVRLLRGRIED